MQQIRDSWKKKGEGEDPQGLPRADEINIKYIQNLQPLFESARTEAKRWCSSGAATANICSHSPRQGRKRDNRGSGLRARARL